MPQPTFHFELSNKDRERAHQMMKEMTEAATVLGGFLPGSEPQFLKMGFALHTTGTTKIGPTQNKGVVDSHSQVWGYENLYLGGGCVIPTGVACNTTLTMVALAIRAAEHLATKALAAKKVTYQLSVDEKNEVKID
jgi:pyranose oxidase